MVKRISEADLEFCWEQVFQYDPWFRLHYLFAPRKLAPGILGLHALMALLESTLDSSEESLAMSQLSWWQSELEPKRAMASAHPAIRVLRSAGSGQSLSVSLTDPLIAQVLLRLQAAPLTDEVALKNICNQIGQAKISAEIGLYKPQITDRGASWWAAGSGLVSLVEFALRSGQKSWWFIPLELQAKHQLDASEIEEQGASKKVILKSLCRWSEAWFDEQLENIAKNQALDSDLRRHLVAMSQAQMLRVRKLASSARGVEWGKPGRWGFKELMTVWSSTRRAVSKGR